MSKMKTIRPISVSYFLVLKTTLLQLLLLSTATFANSVEDSDDGRLKELELQVHQLNRKNVLLGLKDHHQDREIRMLKTLMSKIVKIPKLVAKNYEDGNDNAPMEMQKRPARLLPASFFRKKERKQIVGPPSSCNDLNELGYTLNGIYLVGRGRSNNLDRLKMLPVSAVFCDFQNEMDEHHSPSSTPLKESKLGYLKLKSTESGIHFYVQIGKEDQFVPETGVLRYSHEVSNIGGAMDLKSGVFTAPIAGTYSFSFSMTKNPDNFDYFEIALRLNGARIALSVAGNGYFGAPVTLQSVLKLKKGDRIDLWKSHGEFHKLCGSFCHHFIGSLIEEDFLD